MRSRFFLLLLLLGVMAITSACGADSGTPTRAINTDSDLHRVFALMPDSEQSRRYIRVVNLRRIAEYVGAPIPPAGATQDELDAWGQAFVGATVSELPPQGIQLILSSDQLLTGFNRTRGPEPSANTREGLGFDLTDLDLMAMTGELDGSSSPTLELVIGGMSVSEAETAIIGCDGCPGHEVVERGEVTYYSWGEDYKQSLENRLAPPAFDHLGRGGRVRVGDGHAFRSLVTADMEAAIDAETGLVPSLLDQEDWKLAADVLSQYDLMMATASTQSVEQVDYPKLTPMYQVVQAGAPNAPEWAQEWVDSYPEIAATVTASAAVLPEFSLAITGLVGGDDGFECVIALVFPDGTSAEQAAQALRERAESGLRDAQREGLVDWSDSIVESSFEADGRVVIGRIVPVSDEDGRSQFDRFMIAPVPGVDFVGGSQPEGLGPTAEFLIR